MEVEIRVIGEEDKDDWMKVLEDSPYASIFHRWDWLKIAEKHSGCKFYPLVGYVDQGTKPMAIFPIFYQKTKLMRSVFSPPNKTAIPYLGPLISLYDELKQNKREGLLFSFKEECDKFMKTLRPHYINITLPYGFIDARPYLWSGYQVEPRYNYSIDLRKGSEEIFKGFTKNLRQSINNAEKKGVVVEKGGEEELRMIYDMLKENYSNQNRRLPLSLDYIIDICKTFYPDNMVIFVAKHQGEILGGMVDIHYKTKSYSWIGNTKNPNTKYDVNELIQWKAIQLGCDIGLKEYEIIGANTPRLSPFKTKFNPDLTVYYNATKCSSPWVKMAEYGYLNVLKPLDGKISTMRAKKKK